jgi:hypothetical protein
VVQFYFKHRTCLGASRSGSRLTGLQLVLLDQLTGRRFTLLDQLTFFQLVILKAGLAFLEEIWLTPALNQD